MSATAYAPATLPLDDDTYIDVLGLDAETAHELEGSSLCWYPEPPEHEHRCPECGHDWTHRDEECATDGVPDPWRGGITRSGYATCGECFAPTYSGASL